MKKKLTKSNNNIVLTGTLAGIAEYLGIDPTVVRVIYVILSLVAFGSPIILYILLALIIPSARKNVQVMDTITNIMKTTTIVNKQKNVKRQRKKSMTMSGVTFNVLPSTDHRQFADFYLISSSFSKCSLCK